MTASGNSLYYKVKFGDGRYRAAYGTHNSTCTGEENRNYPAEIDTTDASGEERTVKCGKWLEWQYMKYGSGSLACKEPLPWMDITGGNVTD